MEIFLFFLPCRAGGSSFFPRGAQLFIWREKSIKPSSPLTQGRIPTKLFDLNRIYICPYKSCQMCHHHFVSKAGLDNLIYMLNALVRFLSNLRVCLTQSYQGGWKYMAGGKGVCDGWCSLGGACEYCSWAKWMSQPERTCTSSKPHDTLKLNALHCTSHVDWVVGGCHSSSVYWV